MMRSFLAVLLIAVLVAPANAQSPYDCVPHVLVYGPEPVTLPQTLAPTDSPERPMSRWRADGPPIGPGWAGVTSARRSDAREAGSSPRECPTLVRVQGWRDGGWTSDLEQDVTTYDAAERPLTITERVTSGTSLRDYTREHYTYDAAGMQVEYLVERDEQGTGQVQPINRILFTTDAEGRLLSDVYEAREGTGWLPLSRETYAYEAGPSATGYLREAPLAEGRWEPVYRGAFTYTEDGLRQTLAYEAWRDSEWTLVRRETWVYSAGHAVSVTREFVDTFSTVGRDRTLFEYDGPLLLSLLEQRGVGDGWEDITRKSYTYGGDGRLSSYAYAVSQGDGIPLNLTRTLYLYSGGGLFESQFQGWDGANWFTDGREVYTRLLDGRVAERVLQRLNGTEWVNLNRLLFRYDGTTATETPAGALGMSLRAPAPNPTTGHAALTFTLDSPGPARLSVVDALGREVAVLFDGPAAVGETTATFDGSGLPAGIYSARLVASGRVETQRVTVVR